MGRTTLLTFDGGASISIVVEIIALRGSCGPKSIVVENLMFDVCYTHERSAVIAEGISRLNHYLSDLEFLNKYFVTFTYESSVVDVII